MKNHTEPAMTTAATPPIVPPAMAPALLGDPASLLGSRADESAVPDVVAVEVKAVLAGAEDSPGIVTEGMWARVMVGCRSASDQHPQACKGESSHVYLAHPGSVEFVLRAFELACPTGA